MKKFAAIFLLFLLDGLYVRAQSAFDKEIAQAVMRLNCSEPTEQDPVMLNAGLLVRKDSAAVIVKVRLAPGWHIYQFVPSTLPYIPIDHILKLPEGLKVAGRWQMSKPFPSANDPGVLIYEGEAWFVQKVVGVSNARGVIHAGLYYQTCDLKQCLPPVEKVVELKLDRMN